MPNSEVIDAEFYEDDDPRADGGKRKPSDYANAVAEVCEVVAKPVGRVDGELAGKLRGHASTIREVGAEVDAAVDKAGVVWGKVKELSEKAQKMRPSPVIRRRF